MISSYIFTAIICGIFMLLYRTKRVEQKPYRLWQVICCFIVTRLLTLLSLPYKEIGNLVCLGIDLVIVCVVYLYAWKRYSLEKAASMALLVIFNPVNLIGFLWADYERMIMIAIVVFAVLLIDFLLSKLVRNHESMHITESYALLCFGFVLYFCATDEYSQILGDILDEEEAFPYLLLIGIAVIVFSMVLLIVQGIVTIASSKKVQVRSESVAAECVPYPGVSKWDIGWMSWLTTVFAVAVFVHLGSSYAPQTEVHLTVDDKQNELVIDLGSEKTIREIGLYDGYLSDRKLAISYFDEQSREWVLVNEDAVLDYCFTWGYFPVDMTCRYIGLVVKEDEAYLREMVLFDENGALVTPVVKTEYEALFDEQHMYASERTTYYGTMFDEIYHGRTAYEMIHGLPIYETTHPPLGKVLISLGIRLFGMSPFGWRFMPAVFGIMMVPLVYLFGLRLTRKTKYAILTTVLLCTEFMHYTLSRIATVDIIVAFFFLCMFYFMLCYVDDLKEGKSNRILWTYLVLCGISSGFAVATKWTGVYALAGIAVLFFVFLWMHIASMGGIKENKSYLWKLFGVCASSFIVIPFVIYLLSYVSFVPQSDEKNLLLIMWDNAQYMLSYHQGVVDEHPYASYWYEWLINKRPLLDAFDFVGDDKQSVVATFGNPLICWGGLVAVLHTFLLWWKKRDHQAFFLIVSFVSMLLPWVFINRTVFIYQYFGGMLILVLMMAYNLSAIKRGKTVLYYLVTVLSIGLFVLFFPVLSGIYVNREYYQILKWLPSWPFCA